MSDRPTATVYSMADARAARETQEYRDGIEQAEQQTESETGHQLGLREKVFFRNLGYFSERICNPAYGGKFSFTPVRLKVSGGLAVRVVTGVGEWFLQLDEDDLCINPAVDPVVVRWSAESPVPPVISRAPKFEEVV